MPLLRLDRHGRNRTSFESGERDRLAGHFAKAIFALVYPARRSVDLGDKLALAVAGPKLDTPVGFARRAVGNVGFSDRAALELCHRVARFADDRLFPVELLLAEIGELERAHELFADARPIAGHEHSPHLQTILRFANVLESLGQKTHQN